MPSDTLLYGALALGAAEVTGVTNFTGGGGGGGGDGSSGGGVGNISIPGLGGLRQSVTDAVTAAESAREAARYARLLEETSDAAGRTVTETTKTVERIINVGGGGGGGGDGGADRGGGGGADRGGGGQSGFTVSPNVGPGNPEGYQFQHDYQGPFAELVAGGAEAGHQGGQWVNAGVEAGKGGYEFLSGIESDAWGDLESVASGNYTPDENSLAGKIEPVAKKSVSKGGFFDSIDGSVSESIGRQFDSTKGGGFLDFGQPQPRPDPAESPGRSTSSSTDSTSTRRERKEERRQKKDSSGGGSSGGDSSTLRDAIGPSVEEQQAATTNSNQWSFIGDAMSGGN